MQPYAHRWLTLVALAGTGCSKPPESPPPPAAADAAPLTPSRWVVAADRLDTLQVGWPLARFNAAIGEQLRPTYQISDECDVLRPAGFPAGLSVMVVLDTVVRFDVDTTGILTREGAGVGDTEERVLQVYLGRITVQPHKYTGPTGHYLIVTPPGDTRHRIIFETDGKKVLNYRAGSVPAVELVEGCA